MCTYEMGILRISIVAVIFCVQSRYTTDECVLCLDAVNCINKYGIHGDKCSPYSGHSVIVLNQSREKKGEKIVAVGQKTAQHCFIP